MLLGTSSSTVCRIGIMMSVTGARVLCVLLVEFPMS